MDGLAWPSEEIVARHALRSLPDIRTNHLVGAESARRLGGVPNVRLFRFRPPVEHRFHPSLPAQAVRPIAAA